MYRIGWKHQIWHWVGAGYRVVVPDMLGYGETDKPDDPQEYSLKKISEDLKSILDVIRVDAAVSPGRVKSTKIGDDQLCCST